MLQNCKHSKSEYRDPNDHPAKKFELSVNLSKNATKWPKNGQKWPKVAQIWPQMALNGPKWPKNDPKWSNKFPQFLLTEKAVRQTFSLLECMCTPSKHTIITHQDWKSFWIKALIYLILVLWTESCSHRWLIASLSSANFFCLLCYNYTAEHHAISPKSLAGRC